MSLVLEKFIKMYGRLPTEIDPDYLELLNMSKYKILDTPFHKPGKCSNCGSTKPGRKYIDFGLEIDWYGIVYLCTICLEDIARASGIFASVLTELEAEKNKNTSLDELIEKGDALHETVRHAFRSLEDFYGEISDLQSGNTDSDSSQSPDLEPGSSAENKSNSDESAPTGKTRTTKSTSGSRPKDFPSLAELIERSTSGNNPKG